MAQKKCKNHGVVDAIWKTVTKKSTGQPTSFWACPINAKNPDGTWMKCFLEDVDDSIHPEPAHVPTPYKEPVANTTQKTGVQSHSEDREENITRIAIAKSLIEAGRKWDMISAKEANGWFDWCMGRGMGVNLGSGVLAPPTKPAGMSEYKDDGGEISVDDIPF